MDYRIVIRYISSKKFSQIYVFIIVFISNYIIN